MADPFWTPGLSPALAQAEVAEAAARAAPGQAAGADGFTEEAGAHVALDRARRAIAASGAPAVTGTDDDLFREPPPWPGAGSTYTTRYCGPAFPPGAGGGDSTSTTAVLPGAGEHLPGCGCGPCASREVAEILAVLCEPLGLPGNELEEKLPYGTAPPGTCQTCFRGPVYEAKHLHQLCLYCWTLNQLNVAESTRIAAAPPAPDWRDSAEGMPCYPACDHGGRTQRFARDGSCRRCGAPVPAGRRRVHLHQPGQSRCRECESRDRPPFYGARLAMAAAGWIILTAAVSQPGAIWLIVPAVALIVLGFRGGIRRRR